MLLFDVFPVAGSARRAVRCTVERKFALTMDQGWQFAKTIGQRWSGAIEGLRAADHAGTRIFAQRGLHREGDRRSGRRAALDRTAHREFDPGPGHQRRARGSERRAGMIVRKNMAELEKMRAAGLLVWKV